MDEIVSTPNKLSPILDEKGFVFLGDKNTPFLCRMWGDRPWLFYWHQDNHWVSLRPASPTEIWAFPRNLTKEQQDIYHKMSSDYLRIELQEGELLDGE